MTGGWSATATPTATAPRAPIRNWPWAPMLNRPALKPSATDSPPRMSGVDCDQRLDDRAEAADRRPRSAIDRRRPAGPRSNSWSGTSNSENQMTKAPTTSARQDRDERQAGDAPDPRPADCASRTRRRSRPLMPRHAGSRARTRRQRVPRLAAGRHQQADLVLVGRPTVDGRHDPAAVHDRDPVRQLEHLVELRGDEQDRRSRRRASGSPGGG